MSGTRSFGKDLTQLANTWIQAQSISGTVQAFKVKALSAALVSEISIFDGTAFGTDGNRLAGFITGFGGFTKGVGLNSAGVIGWDSTTNLGGGTQDTVIAREAAGIVGSPGSLRVMNATPIPAGGTASAGLKATSAIDFGVFFGSGAPTLVAAKGSLYLRSNGTGVADRAFINTDGVSVWTAIATAG